MSATAEIPVTSPCPAPDAARTAPGAAPASSSSLDAGLVSPLVDGTVALDADPASHGNRSFVITWILSLLLGFLGFDRFYTGRYRTGALKLLSLGGLGIWWIIDLVTVLAGGLRYDSRPLRGFNQDKEIAWIATGLTIIVAYSMQVDELLLALLAHLF
ncbi:NINE protein [Brevibacterium atlanticum]|uniref:NINE protein n=1 Tax=Brevibacterium atlanticum TaxID=2697563 RepID=UPI001422CE07|nr:NINE protein [Brevibacterium atlanticum]